jgi:hypothetical protein
VVIVTNVQVRGVEPEVGEVGVVRASLLEASSRSEHMRG